MPLSMNELPLRYHCRRSLVVPGSDWRTDSDTPFGDRYFYGSGQVHYDIVNVPFYGRMYDTAVFAHPISPMDHLAVPRVQLTHIQFVLSQLRDIQQRCRDDDRTTRSELRARQQSINVLQNLRINMLQEHEDHYYARRPFGSALMLRESTSEHFRDVNWSQEEGVSPTTQTRGQACTASHERVSVA